MAVLEVFDALTRRSGEEYEDAFGVRPLTLWPGW